MECVYAAYGLRVRSDAEIAGLPAADSAGPPDIRIWLNQRPGGTSRGTRERWYQSLQLNDAGRPNLVIWRTVPAGAFHFIYDDGAEFLIEADGRQVWCTLPPALTAADAAVYLRGPILGMVLRLQGFVCLHASSVAVGSGAIAIIGSAGAGKSTTAAGLVKLGCRLLADDVSALRLQDDQLFVQPGFPRIQLWPDAAAALYGGDRELPRLMTRSGPHGWWDKRYVEMDRDRSFQRTALPLSAVYMLGARRAGTRGPRTEPVGAHEALVELTEDTYVNYALDTAMRAREFHVLGHLVRTVPVRRVVASYDGEGVLELCRSVLDDRGGS